MKQPQFTDRTIQTPLWRDNAESLRAMREARRARWHRIAFPFLVLMFALACVRLVVWFNSLP